MSGSVTPPGQRALFANAPVIPAAPTLPTVPPGSNLAAAMSAQMGRPMNLQTPSMNIPLGSIMALMKGQQGTPNPTPGNNQTGLVRGPDGSWVAGPSMGGQMPTLSWASDVPQQPQQALAPGMPNSGAPGMPAMGAPGVPGPGAPGAPSMAAPGVPGADQPGLFGQTMSWLQNLYGGGGGGYSGGGG